LQIVRKLMAASGVTAFCKASAGSAWAIIAVMLSRLLNSLASITVPAAAFCALLIGGCAASLQKPPDVAADEYFPGASYSLLMAEIAMQRKSWLVTAREYLNAAEQSEDPELARRATEFAAEFGYDVFALGAVRRWLELQPDGLLANEYAGRLYLRRNELDQALIHWRASFGDVALSDEEYLRVAGDIAEEGNLAGATWLLVRLVNEYPDEVGLRMGLAFAALRSGSYELALAEAQRIAVERPDWIQPQLVIPGALLSLEREYEAFAYLDDALDAGESTTLELEYVRLLSAIGRHEEATRRLASLGKIYGAQPELVRLHAQIAFAAGDFIAAAKDYEQLLANAVNVYESRFMLGRMAMAQNDCGRAIANFDRVLGGGYLMQAQLGIASCYENSGDADAALEQLRSFAEKHPRLALDIATAEAQMMFRSGRVDEALAHYQTVIRLQPNQIGLLLEYGSVLDLAGRYDEAVKVLRQVVEIAPTNANALNSLGYTLTNRTRRHDEAYRLIRTAFEIDPQSAPIMDSMGWVLYRRGFVDEARSYLELALDELEDPELIAHLGEVLWVSDERERALALWDRGLIDYPDNQPLIETRARFMP
jgi:tetratricopeptide (TPR) repeat protein